MRKKLSVTLFIVAWVCMAAVTFQNYVLSNGVELTGTGPLIFSGVIFAVALAVIFYARNLAQKGVLT